MIDIHTHLLPGMDDGAQTMEDSIKMAEMALESGIHSLIVTPHCNIEGLYENYYNDKFMKKFLEFEEGLAKENIPLRIMPGMEVYGTEEVPELILRGEIATLNNSRYLLLEFGFHKDISLMEYLINEITDLGLKPIIAHPERYPYVQKNPDMTVHWIEQGCSLQVNKDSIMGSFGHHVRNTALYLLKNNLISIIASDAHGLMMRTTNLSEVYRFICNNFSDGYARMLLEENPLRVIEDKNLLISDGKTMRELIY